MDSKPIIQKPFDEKKELVVEYPILEEDKTTIFKGCINRLIIWRVSYVKLAL